MILVWEGVGRQTDLAYDGKGRGRFDAVYAGQIHPGDTDQFGTQIETRLILARLVPGATLGNGSLPRPFDVGVPF